MRRYSAQAVLALLWLLILTLGAFASSSFGPDPLAIDLGNRLVAPGAAYLLGADELGRSFAARFWRAGQFTLLVTVASTALSLFIGLILGLIAGWYGGWVDRIVHGLIALFWSVPLAVFAVLALTVLGPGLGPLIFVIGCINWVGSARIVRTATMELRQAAFVRAARALGLPAWRVLLVHVLPNLARTVTVLTGFGAAEIIALESGLAYLGLSARPPSPTWGGMMADGIPYLGPAWWLSLIPAIGVILTIWALRTLALSISKWATHGER
ncbi:MAG: ABC transporter permease [Rhodocyclaceae bacterium]|nr:ABC transporter permease [Rhodocyclaceae bacterium]